jgi:2-iminobutanoate/2-iminopropanoate deaminase
VGGGWNRLNEPKFSGVIHEVEAEVAPVRGLHFQALSRRPKERKPAMKKVKIVLAIAAVAAMTVGCSAPAPQSQSQVQQPVEQAKAINPPGTPEGLPFSNGILVGNTLYVAGTQGTDANGKLEPDIESQTRAALQLIQKIVEGGGMTMGNVVAVNVYLSDINDFGKMNGVYKTFFPDPKPTRTTVQVAKLVNGAKIEISAIAVKPR